MKLRYVLLLFLVSLLMHGCYPGITGKVLDAETGKPIEGAIVLVEWTKTKGFGLTYTESFKVVEVLSNKDGAFTIPGVYNPLVNSPDMTVYKPGYVAWNYKIIFPDRNNRTDFKWGVAYTFRLEHFKSDYSHDEHTSFIHSITNASLGSKKELIAKAYRWEELKASDELDDKWKKLQHKVPETSQ